MDRDAMIDALERMLRAFGARYVIVQFDDGRFNDRVQYGVAEFAYKLGDFWDDGAQAPDQTQDSA
jgi:hypothetical protein